MRVSTAHLDILTALPPPWACFAACELAAVPQLFDPANLLIDGIVVRTVRGERCLSRGELHQEWGEAWRFPPTLSHQWSAFPEEITDMGWWHAKNYLTVITQAHRFFEDASTRDLAALGAILEAVARYWANPPPEPPHWHPFPIPFHVVFQCEPKHAAKTRARLQSAKITAHELFMG